MIATWPEKYQAILKNGNKSHMFESSIRTKNFQSLFQFHQHIIKYELHNKNDCTSKNSSCQKGRQKQVGMSQIVQKPIYNYHQATYKKNCEFKSNFPKTHSDVLLKQFKGQENSGYVGEGHNKAQLQMDTSAKHKEELILIQDQDKGSKILKQAESQPENFQLQNLNPPQGNGQQVGVENDQNTLNGIEKYQKFNEIDFDETQKNLVNVLILNQQNESEEKNYESKIELNLADNIVMLMGTLGVGKKSIMRKLFPDTQIVEFTPFNKKEYQQVQFLAQQYRNELLAKSALQGSTAQLKKVRKFVDSDNILVNDIPSMFQNDKNYELLIQPKLL